MLEPADLKIDVYRSSESTGEHEATIRITHIPTGIAVSREAVSSVEETKAALIRELEERLNAGSGQP